VGRQNENQQRKNRDCWDASSNPIHFSTSKARRPMGWALGPNFCSEGSEIC
jgi:hypothetical protein